MFYYYPYFDYEINQYGYYSGTSYYETTPPWWEYGVKLVRDWYPSQLSYLALDPDAYSISGQSYCSFYNNSNGIWYVSVTPDYFNGMWANPPPPTNYSGPP